ncbi:MAG: hypothetical protein N2V75_10230 [Methanophagales archaeon]|nr:hypothetical protein [Methanophagales archaeon]
MERNTPKQIGKGIENYNAVDCGMFYCTSEMFDALDIGKDKILPIFLHKLSDIHFININMFPHNHNTSKRRFIPQ